MELKLLIAEDTADNRVLLNRYLKDTGADTDFAVDGAEAINKARASHYDFILMDIQMPNVDGIQAARALRHEGYTGPLVALTAHAMPKERERSLRAGYNAHLTKPVAKQTLIAAIREFSAALS